MAQTETDWLKVIKTLFSARQHTFKKHKTQKGEHKESHTDRH